MNTHRTFRGYCLVADVQYFPEQVMVEVQILFQSEEEWLPTGALIPSGFRKKITTPDHEYLFEFPNQDVAGEDWSNFRIVE